MHNEEKGGRYGIRPTRERTLQVIAKELRTAHDPEGTPAVHALRARCASSGTVDSVGLRADRCMVVEHVSRAATGQNALCTCSRQKAVRN